MARKNKGGSSTPVKVIQESDLESNGGSYKLFTKTAIPVSTLDTRKVKGGPVSPVFVVTQAQIDSGEYKLQGGVAIPVTSISDTGRDTTEVAIPVYVVDGQLDPGGGGGNGSTTVFYDSFTDTSGTQLSVHIPDISIGGAMWVEHSLWDILNNRARAEVNANTQVTVDMGVSDAVITSTISTLASNSSRYGFSLRRANNLNMIIVDFQNSGNVARLRRRLLGVDLTVDSATVSLSTNSDYTVVITMSGHSINVSFDGVPILSGVISDLFLETRHGLFSSAISSSHWGHEDFRIEV